MKRKFYKYLKNGSLLSALILSSNLSFAQATLKVRVNTSTDDMEEVISGPNTLGTMDAASSDIELGSEDNASGTLSNAQLVGIRFNNITIPKGTVITNAYIQFTVDAVTKNSDPANLTIVGEATDNAVTFDPTVNFNLTSRPKTTSSVSWNIPAGSWASATPAPVAGTDQRTSNIKPILDEIINRTGWASGNSLAIYISGSGLREAHSFEGNAANAAELVIEYEGTQVVNPPALGCTGAADHIGCFTSVQPLAQQPTMIIPSTHAFQILFQRAQAYTKVPSATASSNFDFTGFIPEGMNSSTKGHLSINHETTPGGISMLDIHYDQLTERWSVDTSQAISFASVGRTIRNCSGGVTHWETVITAEENTATGTLTAYGYEVEGWLVEVDPKINKVKQYGNGKEEKLWAMGRMSHENVALKKDSLTAYYGDDTPSGNVFKFVANNKMNMSSGTLYVLKLTTQMVNSEPTSTSGTWVVVPNTTPNERNTTKSLAAGLGATTFDGVEDVEIGTLDGKIYFTAKGNSRTYRFSDNGTTVSNFETFVGGKSYPINYETGTVLEPWGIGNDNLTFDDKGNLWVLQDGGKDLIWLVRPDHTQADPKVEVFMVTPIGCEPTGMTFSPDYKFMFLSLQNPSSTAFQMDVTGTSYPMNKDYTMVIARTQYLDGLGVTSLSDVVESNEFIFSTYPNPSKGAFRVSYRLEKNSQVEVKLMDQTGRQVYAEKFQGMAGENVNNIETNVKGVFLLQMNINGEITSKKVVLH